jgi:hypothetical protein
MHRVFPLLAVLALRALSASASPGEPAVTGPLRVDNAYPAILPFLVVPAEGPGDLGPRRFELSLAASYGNAFNWDPMVRYPDLEVLIDAEVLKLTLSAAWGLGRGFSVEAGISVVGEYGGFLDSWISGFHEFFWLQNAGRDHQPANSYGFRIVKGGEVMVDLDEPFWALGDLVISGKWTILDGQARGFGAALQAALSLPIGSVKSFTSSGKLNASLGALASWRHAPFAVYGGARYLYFGEPAWGPVLGFRPHNFGFFVCLEWARLANLAWLLQADGATLPYLHPHPWLGAMSSTISLGARVRVNPRFLLEMYLSEELFSFATLDIAAGCVARLAFGR